MSALTDVIAAQGIEDPDLRPGELVSSAVILLHTVTEDGTEAIHVASTDGMSRLTRMGILTDALDGDRAPGWRTDA